MPRPQIKRSHLGFDILEDRTVPAGGLTASLANGQLSILGTPGNDVITVRQIPPQFRMAGQIRIDGLAQTFDPAKVSKIVVQGGDGDDTITMIATKAITAKSALSVELWGGEGNDTIYGSVNTDRLFGEAGDDIIHGGAGNDLLDGADGNDQLYGEAGGDMIFGGNGDDRMYGGESSDYLVGGTGSDFYQGNYGVDYYIEAHQEQDVYNDGTEDGNHVYQMAGATHPLAFYDTLHDNGVRSAVLNGAYDGQFTRQDALNLFAQVRKDGITSELEFNDLQALLRNNPVHMANSVFQLFTNVVDTNVANQWYQGSALGNLAPDSPADQLNKLVQKWFMGQDHPETLSAAHTYQYAQGTLFGKGTITPLDLQLGYANLKDNNLYVSFMSVAQTDSTAIRNMFSDNGDGTFTVRLYDGSRECFVTVDRYLPADSTGKLVYGQIGSSVNNAGNILWPALLEKAFAQAAEQGILPQQTSNTVNSYRSIDAASGNHLFAGQFLSTLTGKYTTGDAMSAATLPDFLDALRSKEFVVVCANYPPCCGSLPNPNVATGRYYTILSYNPAKGGSFKMLASTGSGRAIDIAGRSVPGIITLTTAEFLANMQFYETTMPDTF